MAILAELQIVFKGATKFSLLWMLWQWGLYLTLFNQIPGQPIDSSRGAKSTDFFKMLAGIDGKKLLPRQTAVLRTIFVNDGVIILYIEGFSISIELFREAHMK